MTKLIYMRNSWKCMNCYSENVKGAMFKWDKKVDEYLMCMIELNDVIGWFNV